MLVQAIICMNLALIFYTWAVFSARRRGLHRNHLFIFGVGLVSDYLGTHMMLLYGHSVGLMPVRHTIIGIASLAGMAFHFLLAFYASVVRKTDTVNRLFHRVSLTIYTSWLVAFCSGAIVSMRWK